MSKKHKRYSTDDKQPQIKQLKAKTPGQIDYIRAIVESDIVFCTGPSGVGKTAVAVGLACEHLRYNKIQKIVITRPIVTTGYNKLGAMPGNVIDKLNPYIFPALTELYYYLGKHNTLNYINNGIIQIVPLEVMRGYTFNHSFIIVEEAQNADLDQLKMILTRIGAGSTLIISGDIEQSDLREMDMGLLHCVNKLHDIKGVSIVTLTHSDIIRNKIISKILMRLD